jgi:phosphatidylethanolamine/phosphatidyl-N-methylethanolamine N-methyltransferase
MTDATGMIDQSETARIYDRIAPLYDLIDGIYEHAWKRGLRQKLFAHARGRILDVGIGTGCNIPFYPDGSEVVGIDMSERMLDRARDRAQELGRPMTLRPMNLLSLDFPDASFDTVSATFVLLCLPDELQEAALRELRRVTRPDGRVLLLDYRRSRQPGVRLLRQCLSPWLKWAFAATFDATTERYLAAAGLATLHRRTFMGDGVSLLVLEPTEAAVAARSAA